MRRKKTKISFIAHDLLLINIDVKSSYLRKEKRRRIRAIIDLMFSFTLYTNKNNRRNQIKNKNIYPTQRKINVERDRKANVLCKKKENEMINE